MAAPATPFPACRRCRRRRHLGLHAAGLDLHRRRYDHELVLDSKNARPTAGSPRLRPAAHFDVIGARVPRRARPRSGAAGARRGGGYDTDGDPANTGHTFKAIPCASGGRAAGDATPTGVAAESSGDRRRGGDSCTPPRADTVMPRLQSTGGDPTAAARRSDESSQPSAGRLLDDPIALQEQHLDAVDHPVEHQLAGCGPSTPGS